MYNRYIPQEADYGPIPPPGGPPPRDDTEGGGLGGLLGGLLGGEGKGPASRLLERLRRNLDLGDVLLALIVALLVLEDGDDLELIVALALMLLPEPGDR